MAIKIGINGFGRIGRMVFRAAVQNFSEIEVVAINDLLEPEYLAYMLQYDSVHGRFKGTIAVDGNTLIVNGKRIRLTQEKDPGQPEVGRGRRDDRRRVDRPLPHQGDGAEAPRRGREEGDPVGAVEGRHADVRLRRQRQELQGRGDHLERVVHDQLPGAGRQGAQRQVGHQARPDDDGARDDGDAEDRRRPEQQGLARRPRHPREHHPVVDRRGEGRSASSSRRSTRSSPACRSACRRRTCR
jgi:hypothetical protein